MEQLTTATLTQLPQVRALGRHTGRDPLTLFWTASGMELEFTGSELWVDLFADYEVVEPWVSVELNGAWVARFAVNPGKSRICLFRGMTPGKAKHLRLLKDVQAMHDDPAHLLQITGLEYAGGEFLPLPEPQYRLEFVGDSITSGEGAIGAKPEEDWVGAFFSAENHYGRLTADALGAEYRCISQSGWGLVTGWDNDVRHVMPPYYTQVCGVAMGQRNAALGAQQENDFAAWKPDAVIVNLGTNDTGAFDNPPWQDPATGKPHQLRRLSNGDFHPADAQKVANGVQHFLPLLRGHVVLDDDLIAVLDTFVADIGTVHALEHDLHIPALGTAERAAVAARSAPMVIVVLILRHHFPRFERTSSISPYSFASRAESQ